MTKKELRAEIEKLQKAYGLRYYGGINSMKKAELESFLNDIKYAHSLKCNTEAETVETEAKVENIENTVEVETKATKKDIIMGLSDDVYIYSDRCDLNTAEAIAKGSFIEVYSYDGGLFIEV